MNTKQELFEAVVKHTITQGYRSVNSYDQCQYDNGKGGRCAFGGLFNRDILKELSNTNLQNATIVTVIEEAVRSSYDYPKLSNFLNQCPVLREAIKTTEESFFLRALQNIHDLPENWHCEEAMKTAIKQVANTYKLDQSFMNVVCWDNFQPKL